MLTKAATEVLSEATLAAGSTVPTSPEGSECDLIDLTDTAQLAVTLEATCVAGATGSISAHIRTSHSGGTEASEWDTVNYTSFTLPAVASAYVQKTEAIWCDPKYMKVMVVNGGTEAVNTVKVTTTIQDVEAA